MSCTIWNIWRLTHILRVLWLVVWLENTCIYWAQADSILSRSSPSQNPVELFVYELVIFSIFNVQIFNNHEKKSIPYEFRRSADLVLLTARHATLSRCVLQPCMHTLYTTDTELCIRWERESCTRNVQCVRAGHCLLYTGLARLERLDLYTEPVEPALYTEPSRVFRVKSQD